MLVGRTWSFNKRFIRLLFPALVSPVKNTNTLLVIVSKKSQSCAREQVDIIRAPNALLGQITVSRLPYHQELILELLHIILAFL